MHECDVEGRIDPEHGARCRVRGAVVHGETHRPGNDVRGRHEPVRSHEESRPDAGSGTGACLHTKHAVLYLPVEIGQGRHRG